jgi:hypothetical protein
VRRTTTAESSFQRADQHRSAPLATETRTNSSADELAFVRTL